MRVVAEGIGFAYPGRPVLSEVDVRIPSGEIGVLVGPSGSGKSTLLGLLSGLVPPGTGRIRFEPEGSAPRPPDPALVAWVPQGLGSLRARSALDNVLVGALARGVPLDVGVDLARRCLARVGLSSRAADPCGRLSGGEQQRVGLARALAMRRPLLFADEPTSHLDAASTDAVIAALTALRGEVTVVIATHDPALMALGPHQVELRGRTTRG